MTKKELELALKTERLANKLLLDKVAELEAKVRDLNLKPLNYPYGVPPQYPYGQPIPCMPQGPDWHTHITCQPNHLYRDNGGNVDQLRTQTAYPQAIQ